MLSIDGGIKSCQDIHPISIYDGRDRRLVFHVDVGSWGCQVEIDQRAHDEDMTSTPRLAYVVRQPHPGSSGYLDRAEYRSVHFYGSRLCDPLAEASEYLERLESETGRPPHVLCVHDEFSEEDDGTDLAWQLTVVVGDPY